MRTRHQLVRGLWTQFEPIHALTYFSEQSRASFAAAGLPRYWDGYFAGRAAPLGAVTGAPIVAIFSGFSPSLVNRALPAAWAVVTPEQALAARVEGAVATLRVLVGGGQAAEEAEQAVSAEHAEEAVARAADALADVAARVDTVGRPLGAANLALSLALESASAAAARGSDPYERLWQAATTLREHRGDGHVLALVAEGIAGLSTIVLRSGSDLDPAAMKRARGWSEDEWNVELARLQQRGLLDDDSAITEAGRAAMARAEALTDKLAAEPWQHLSDDEMLDVARLLAPLAAAVAPVFPFPNPIGMPQPFDPDAEA